METRRNTFSRRDTTVEELLDEDCDEAEEAGERANTDGGVAVVGDETRRGVAPVPELSVRLVSTSTLSPLLRRLRILLMLLPLRPLLLLRSTLPGRLRLAMTCSRSGALLSVDCGPVLLLLFEFRKRDAL
jgi:hypothetical protein